MRFTSGALDGGGGSGSPFIVLLTSPATTRITRNPGRVRCEHPAGDGLGEPGDEPAEALQFRCNGRVEALCGVRLSANILMQTFIAKPKADICSFPLLACALDEAWR